jgi:hypothetical protein
MEKKDCKILSNVELKLYLEVLNNSFEGKKQQLTKICEEMGEIEKEYLNAKHELEIRKNIYL